MSILWILVGTASLLALAVVCSIIWFYRDPDRRTPQIAKAIVSPADGVVTSIRRFSSGKIPSLSKDGRIFQLNELAGSRILESNGFLISIHISPLNVHTVRSPASGVASSIIRIPGELRWMRDATFETRNERVSIILKSEYGVFGLVIVAAPIAAAVNCLLDKDERLDMGQHVAFIRIGSQVDLIIPDSAGVELCVSCGDKVVGGETVLGLCEGKTGCTVTKLNSDCFVPQDSSVIERFYLILLYVASLSLKAYRELRSTKKVRRHRDNHADCRS